MKRNAKRNHRVIWIIIFCSLVWAAIVLHRVWRADWIEKEVQLKNEYKTDDPIEWKRKKIEKLIERLRVRQDWQWV